MAYDRWDGTAYDTGASWRLILVAGAAPDPRRPATLLAAVASGGRAIPHEVPPDRFGAFLRACPDATLVAADAAPLFWAIERRLRDLGDEDAAVALWRCVAECRLIDLRLLDALLALAEAGQERRPRPLADIVADHLGHALPDPASRGSASIGTFGDGPFAGYAGRMAEILGELDDRLRERARRIAEAHDLDPESGPLSLGLQVQGAVALNAPSVCGGLPLQHGLLPRLRAQAQDAYAEASRRLHRRVDAPRCFAWDGEIVRRDPRGHPKDDRGRLKGRLGRALSEGCDVSGLAFEPPRAETGGIATSAAAWAALADRDPFLGDWTMLESSAEVRRLLDARGAGATMPTLAPAYEAWPRITSRGPCLELARRWAPGPLFGAPRGRRILVAELQDLELRHLACLHAGPGGRSSLIDLFQARLRPRERVAIRLYRAEEELGDLKHWVAFLAQQQHEDPERHGRMLEAADFLLRAMLRRMTPERACALMNRVAGAAYTPPRVKQLMDEIGLAVIPELGPFRRDPARTLVHNAIGTLGFHAVFDAVGRVGRFETHLREVLGGKVGDAALMAELRSRCTDPGIAASLGGDRGDPGLYDAIFRPARRCGHGRVRAGREAAHAELDDVLDGADDVRKRVLFEVARAGYELLGCVGDEFAVLVGGRAPRGGDLDAEAHGLKLLAESAAGLLLDPVPAVCMVEPRDTW